MGLDITLMGGQSFCWTREDDHYYAVLDNRVIRIKSLDDIKGDVFLEHYFDMNFDYEKAMKILKEKDQILKESIHAFPDLRILNQDPFTVLISFIISQNNNIKRIKLIRDRIAKEFGKEIESGFYAFPTPNELSKATEEDFKRLGAGFRAKYLVDAVSKANILTKLAGLTYEEAAEKLKEIKGVGDKVAACVLLFGYHRMEAFPLDVWMKRVMDTYYKGKDPSFFDPYRALAQQYLFSYAREIKL